MREDKFRTPLSVLAYRAGLTPDELRFRLKREVGRRQRADFQERNDSAKRDIHQARLQKGYRG